MDSESPSLSRPTGPTREIAGNADRAGELVRRFGPSLGTFVVPFTLVLYLALRGGGYDVVVRSEVGIAVWLIVLFGSLAGLLPVVRLSRVAWVAFVLLAAFAFWTALSMLWTESREETFEEVARIGIYVGIFALALSLQDRHGLKRTVGALGAAAGIVAALAVLSRLHPGPFPTDELAQSDPAAAGRLNYPLNYFNALATFVAMGLPLALAIAAGSRRLVTQALATAALPVMALAIFYSFSRTGLIATVAALATLLALHPRRLALLPTAALAAIGSALVVAAAGQRDALEAGDGSAAALQQGDEMLAVLLVVSAGVAFLRVAVGLATRHGVVAPPRPSKRLVAGAVALAAVAVAGAGIAAGVPSEVSQAWQEFKDPANAVEGSQRFTSASGNGRFQYWGTSLDAAAGAPLLGIGAGAWHLFWAREGTIEGFTAYAHSLYLETFAELGVVGLVLIVGLVGLVAGFGLAVARGAEPDMREMLAAGLAALAAFAIAAGVDWVWQVTVIPVAFLFLAAAILGSRSSDPAALFPQRREPGWSRTLPVFGALALSAIGVIALSMTGAKLVGESERAVASENYELALEKARSAEELQPFSTTPHLRQASALWSQGRLTEAAAEARIAIEKESTSWEPWWLMFRIEYDRGRHAAAEAAYLRGRELNPRSPLFPDERPTVIEELP